MHANCPNGEGNQSNFGRFRYYYVTYLTFARRKWPSCSDYDDVMVFLSECIRIFTTWQTIPFKRTFYLRFYVERLKNKITLILHSGNLKRVRIYVLPEVTRLRSCIGNFIILVVRKTHN